MTRRKTIIVAAAGLIAVVIVVGAVVKNRRGVEERPKVTWAEVLEKTLEETVSGSGSFVSRERISLQTDIPGRIREIHVTDGEGVSTGDLLMTLDDTGFRNALDQAQVAWETTVRQIQEELLGLRQSYIQAENTEKRAADLAERTRNLFDSGSVSREETYRTDDAHREAAMALESARQRVNLALGVALDAGPPVDIQPYRDAVDRAPAVRGALLAVQAAREELSHTRITAPIDGFITGLNLRPGDTVTPQIPLCRIESLNDMIAEVTIDEVDIGKISVGNPVTITSDSLVGEILNGEVTSIAPVVERVGNLRAAVVKASINRGERLLKSGASCLVKIDVKSARAETVIPVTAFFTHTGALWVYLIADETGEDGSIRPVLKKTEVELGRSSLDEVVVSSGLATGDRVVTGNLSNLRDGIAVDLTEDEE